MMNRKEFIKVSTGMVAASAVPLSSLANTNRSVDVSGEKKIIILKKSLVYGMIDEDLSMEDKFKLVKDLGFNGVELNSPNDFNTDEILEAKEKTGIELPSVINNDHWSKPLSDPDPRVRAACIESVATSLQDIKDYGGDTVLVVPGVVNEKVS
jgi:hexulose-6-phosphate isomerase